MDSIDSSVRSDSTSPDWMGEVVVEQGNFNAGFVGYVFDDDGIDDDFVCELVNCPVSPPNTTLECSVERGTESPSEYRGRTPAARFATGSSRTDRIRTSDGP